MRFEDWLKLNKEVFLERDLRFILKSLFSEQVIMSPAVFLDREGLGHLEYIKERYSKGIPLPYILGKEEFFGREFRVNSSVLIPRKETELIVERALELIAANKFKTVLDLGCGCGNICVTIKKMAVSDLTVFASDISFSALLTAQENSSLHNAEINIVNADLLDSFIKRETFDLIVTNPPYVETENIKGSLEYEPRIALDAGAEGLNLIRKILTRARDYLNDRGYLIIEIGYNHQLKLKQEIKRLGGYEIVEWIRDYSGHWRGIVLKIKK